MSERNCGACHLWATKTPDAFEGECCYFPPQLAREAGRLLNVRPVTTRDDGCHIGFRPRDVRPSVMPLDAEATAEVVELARQATSGGMALRGDR